MTESERTRLITNPIVTTNSSIDSNNEISPATDYGSIQAPPNSTAEMDDTKTTLKFFEKIGFSLGHVYNDLCAVSI